MSALPFELAGRLTLTVAECAVLLDLGRDATYDAIERGEIPSIKVGRRIVVPTHRLLDEVLGIAPETVAQILGLAPPERDEAGPSQDPAPAMSTPDPSQFEGDHHHGASVTPVGSITERRRSA